MSSFFLKLFDEKRFVYSVKVFPLNIKSINPIQKYPHIIESYACILEILVVVVMFLLLLLSLLLLLLLLINALISLGICSTPKESK